MSKIVEVTSIEKKSSQDGSKTYYKVSFKEEIEGHKSGSVWDDKIVEGIKPGDLVEVDYKISGNYINLTGLKVKVSGNSNGLKQGNDHGNRLSPEEACNMASAIYKKLKELGVEDPENRTLNTVLIQLMKQ
jgi:hypothetical protein